MKAPAPDNKPEITFWVVVAGGAIALVALAHLVARLYGAPLL